MKHEAEQNIQVIKDMYQAFARGDLPFILERISPVRFERWGVVANGQWRAPWHHPIARPEDVHEYFEAVLGALEPLRFEPGTFAADGDHVYATLHMEYKVRANGKVLVMPEVVHRFKLLEGRVVEARVFEDTEATREALAG